MNKFCYIARVPNSIHAFMRDTIQVVAEKNPVKVISYHLGSEVMDISLLNLLPETLFSILSQAVTGF